MHPIPEVITSNRFISDLPFQALLSRHLSPQARSLSEPWLREMGALSAGEINELAAEADAHPPTLERYDRRGDRAERLVFHPAYRRLEELSYGQGIIGHFYDPAKRACLGPHLWQVKFAMCYLFAQSEQGVYCPIAMTDASAYLLEKHADPALRDRYLPRLAATSMDQLLTGAMFLTEREGGSDVGANTTVARREGGHYLSCDLSHYLISGEKWFCSNAGADLAMVLARVQQEDGSSLPGTKGLGLFLVPRTLPDGSVNSFRVRRLKNKLGTRSMATGEVSLRDAVGYPVGPVERGFLTMTGMLNICRMHNSAAALALTRRVLWEAASYAAQRSAFGRKVDSYLLVQDLLCGLFAELEAGLEVLFSVGRDFMESDNEENQRCLRMMVPLLKLHTAKLAVRAASEAVELVGGNGYVEDFVTARFYRDAQVLPVWEGATNILYLDVLRSVVKMRAHHAVCRRIEQFLEPASGTSLASAVASLLEQTAALERAFDRLPDLSSEHAPVAAKRLCDALWPIYTIARLMAVAGQSYRTAAVVHRLLRNMTGAAAPLAPDEIPAAYQAIVRPALGLEGCETTSSAGS